ncbi:MAG: DUF1295 domain-containing protein [Myxococcota bacterium]
MIRAFAICTVCYVLALAAAAAGVYFLPAEGWLTSPLWRAAIGDLIGTGVVFGFSVAYNNSSFYDAYWSVAPVALAGYWWALAPEGASLLRQGFVFLLVNAWGWRLTYNWARHWRGLDHEDWRYADFRTKVGPLYWAVSFFGFHFFPTVQVFAGMVAAYVAMIGTAPFGAIDVIAIVVTAAATVIEAVADRQLHDFAATNDDPQRILDTGIWGWSQNPNYFGEILFWWGLVLFAVAAVGPTAFVTTTWWAGLGALAINAMFLFISIPLKDERMLKKRPHFAAHQKRISRIIPLPPR